MNQEEKRKKVSKLSQEINSMRTKLCQAVEEERYEDAALIRDDAALKQDELMKLLSCYADNC